MRTKEEIKSIFNLNMILGCYIGAIGYGIGYNLPNKFNLHPIICLVCCFALGSFFESFSNKILSTKFYNASNKNKWIVAIIVYVGYLIAWLIVDYAIDYDLDYDFLTNLGTIIYIQMILLVIKAIKKHKTLNN